MPRRTRLIIAGSVTIFIALVVTLVLLYVNVWSAPTRQDFEHAKTDVNTLDMQYDDLSIALRLYSSSINVVKPDGSKDAKTGYTKAVNAVDASFKKLDDTNALRDKDVKSAYGSLVKKRDEIRAYANDSLLYKKALVKCVGVFDVMHGSTDAKQIAAAHKKAADSCLPLLDRLKHSSISYFADFASSYAGAIRKRQIVFDAAAAKKISQSEVDSRISEIFNTDLKKVIGHDDEFIKAQQNATAHDALQRLKAVLDKKIKQS